VERLFRRHGLVTVRVERLATHGGSLRVRVAKAGAPADSVAALRAAEAARGLTDPGWLAPFTTLVARIRARLPELLRERQAAGWRLAAYGAAAKGATLLNSCGVGRDLLDFVVDRNVHKQGWLMPGVHLPIRGVEELLRRRPDGVLLLAWNFKDEILRQQAAYLAAGGRFLVPVPEPTLL